MHTIVIFVYCVRNDICDVNLKYFIKNGIVPRDDITYYIVINGESSITDIPGAIVIHRENFGGDFAGWWHILRENRADRYILLNDTCRGPFIPRYTTRHWVDLFCERLNTIKNGKIVKIVGPTENWNHHAHIQSYSLGMDNEALEYLIKNSEIFSKFYDGSTILGKKLMIGVQEIGTSRKLIENGWEIYSFLQSQNKYNSNMDVTFRLGQYGGISVNPVELMFIKTTRINGLYVQKYTEWNM